jgi:acyl dehydratase
MNAVNGLKTGDSFSYQRVFTQKEAESFGDLTRDYNPVHYDSRWTEKKGYNGLICHGLLVGSMICEFGGQVGWLATGMDFKFIKPVYFGDAIQCAITITGLEENGRTEAEAIFTNQEGDQVCHAILKGLLPLKHEQELLKQMIDEGDPTNKLSSETYDYMELDDAITR